VSEWLTIALLLAAFGQACIAVINLALVPLMGWKADVQRMPLLVREVFHVHAWFITITLLIFATLTCRFVHEMAAGAAPVYRWLAGGIGGFWAIRTVLQVAYYSSSHWRGIPSRTVAHVVLLIVYGGFAAVYLAAVFRP